jgi:acetyl-CoA synthetase
MSKTSIWKPNQKTISESNINKMMLKLDFSHYDDLWSWSVKNKESFWDETIQALGISFKKKYTQVLNLDNGVTQPNWLVGARMNIIDSCFQRDNSATAIVYNDENGIQHLSQKDLENQVNRIANGLRDFGIKQGDYIAIDLPMTPLAVAIYLAGIKAGNPVVTIADSFSPKEIKVRLEIAKPKLIFTQDYLNRAGKKLPLYEKVTQASNLKTIVIKSCDNTVELRETDVWFSDFEASNSHFETIIQNPNDYITLLFSSGTTSTPKAIPWTQTTPIKAASDGYYHHDIHEGDVVAWPTNLGWMMGPWLVFAALINKASIALYNGAPLGVGFGRFIQEAKVNMLGVIPSIVKHWKNTACMEGLDWSCIRCFSSTGEASNPQEYEYLMSLADHKPIIEYCGGTEIGGGYVTGTIVQNNIPATFSTKALGTDFVLLDENNQESKIGEVFLIPPIMGLSNELLNKNHHQVYYDKTPTYKGQILRRHGDQMQVEENNYFKAQGRVDDAMNLGGIKVSSLQIESLLNTLEYIKETAAIAVHPYNGGPDKLIIYYVLLEDESKENVLKDMQKLVKTQINPLFKVNDVVETKSMPRTASGKLIRRNLRKQYQELNLD